MENNNELKLMRFKQKQKENIINNSNKVNGKKVIKKYQEESELIDKKIKKALTTAGLFMLTYLLIGANIATKLVKEDKDANEIVSGSSYAVNSEIEKEEYLKKFLEVITSPSMYIDEIDNKNKSK